MTLISSAELIKLRSQPQQSKLYLSIYQPSTVLACQVNSASIARKAMIIPYDTVSSGSYASVKSGMTIYIGSTPGAKNVGKLRVRSIDATNIYVAENSDVLWADNLFLTVISFFELWPVYPKLVQNEEITYFYKDQNIAYTNQHTQLGTLVCAGSHYAGFVDEPVIYSASGTYNVIGNTLEYLWAFEGGTPTGSTSAYAGAVNYTTPGHYTTTLQVTSSSGAVDTTYRHVSIYDRPGKGSNEPLTNWELESSLTGDRSSGGYTARIRVREIIPNIPDEALVIIFSEDYYADEKVWIGNNHAGVLFVGYIQAGTLSYDYQDNYMSFEVGSITDTMKITESFSSTLESVITSADWYQLDDLTVVKGLYSFMRWQSTLMLNTDIEFRGTDQKIQYLDTDRSSLYDALNTAMSSILYGSVVADRNGKIWLEQKPPAYEFPTTSFPVVMTLDKQDMLGTPSIEIRNISQTSYVEVGGIAYAGPSVAVYTPLLACAPGDAPGYRGTSVRFQGLALTDQTHLNWLAGNIYANNNARYAEMFFDSSENLPCLDIAPLEIVRVNLFAEDNPQRIVMTNEPFIINNLSISYDSKNQVKRASYSLGQVVNGFTGETMVIPVEPPTESATDIGTIGGFNIPAFIIPSLPSFSLPSITIPSGASSIAKKIMNFGYDFTSSELASRHATIPFDYIKSIDYGRFSSINNGFKVLYDGWYELSYGFQILCGAFYNETVPLMYIGTHLNWNNVLSVDEYQTAQFSSFYWNETGISEHSMVLHLPAGYNVVLDAYIDCQEADIGAWAEISNYLSNWGFRESYLMLRYLGNQSTEWDDIYL